MFNLGEEVVCVDADVEDLDGSRPLVKGQHYIIRWIGDFQKKPCVRVEGIIRPLPPHLQLLTDYLLKESIASGHEVERNDLECILDCPFYAHRFAPIYKKREASEIMRELFGGLSKELEPA